MEERKLKLTIAYKTKEQLQEVLAKYELLGWEYDIIIGVYKDFSNDKNIVEICFSKRV